MGWEKRITRHIGLGVCSWAVVLGCAAGLCRWAVPRGCAAGLCRGAVPLGCAAGLWRWAVALGYGAGLWRWAVALVRAGGCVQAGWQAVACRLAGRLLRAGETNYRATCRGDQSKYASQGLFRRLWL